MKRLPGKLYVHTNDTAKDKTREGSQLLYGKYLSSRAMDPYYSLGDFIGRLEIGHPLLPPVNGKGNPS